MTVPKEAHSVLYDADGDPYEIWAIHGEVTVWIPARGAILGAEGQEAFGQAFTAACNAGRQNAAGGRREVASHG